MKAVVFHEHGGTDRLRYEDFPDPECGPADCLVRVRAVSLNGFEPMILGKTTALRTPLPMIPGGDVAGEVVEVGREAGERFRVGDRVSLYPMVPGEGMTGETRLGGCCELMRAPAASLVPIPDGLSFEHAAALPIAYGTAFRMMTVRGRVQPGETVLILGATGGVGTGCVQLAKRAGATVIACGGAAWKLERLKGIGADHVIDTSNDDLRDAVYRLYGKPRMGGGGGVNVAVNYIGGDTWVECLRLIHPGGRMLVCGATAGYDTRNDIRYIWTYEISIVGSNGWTMADQAEVMRMARDGELAPVIHAVRPLGETAAAIQDLIDRKVFGKLVLVP